MYYELWRRTNFTVIPHIFQNAQLNRTIVDTKTPKCQCITITHLVLGQFSWPNDWLTVFLLVAFVDVPIHKIHFKSCQLLLIENFIIYLKQIQRVSTTCSTSRTEATEIPSWKFFTFIIDSRHFSAFLHSRVYPKKIWKYDINRQTH